jgi:hypothetical protein
VPCDGWRGSDRRRTCRDRSSGAPARQRVEPCLGQLDEHLLISEAIQIGEVGNLDGREALEVHVGPDPLQAAEQVFVVVERQFGVQAVDDVNLSERFVRALAELVQHLLDGHGVRTSITRAQPRERAEQA